MESKNVNAECNEVSLKKVQFSSNIIKCTTTGKKEEIEKNETQEFDYLNIFEKIGNTNPELNLQRLLSNKSDKFLFKNFNVLSKNELSIFGINKKLNNREAYFYFLECLINIEIIGEVIKASLIVKRLQHKKQIQKNQK